MDYYFINTITLNSNYWLQGHHTCSSVYGPCVYMTVCTCTCVPG